MRKHVWVPVAEGLPASLTTVIVCQTAADHRIFAGWIDDGVWHSYWPAPPGGDPAFVANMGFVRATDFWLALPEYPAEDNAERVMRYPA